MSQGISPARGPATTGRTWGQQPPTFYSVAEVAQMLGTSRMTLYRAISAGEFPAIRVRGRWIVPARALDDLVEGALASTGPGDSEAVNS